MNDIRQAMFRARHLISTNGIDDGPIDQLISKWDTRASENVSISTLHLAGLNIRRPDAKTKQSWSISECSLLGVR